MLRAPPGGLLPLAENPTRGQSEDVEEGEEKGVSFQESTPLSEVADLVHGTTSVHEDARDFRYSLRYSMPRLVNE